MVREHRIGIDSFFSVLSSLFILVRLHSIKKRRQKWLCPKLMQIIAKSATIFFVRAVCRVPLWCVSISLHSVSFFHSIWYSRFSYILHELFAAAYINMNVQAILRIQIYSQWQSVDGVVNELNMNNWKLIELVYCLIISCVCVCAFLLFGLFYDFWAGQFALTCEIQ